MKNIISLSGLLLD